MTVKFARYNTRSTIIRNKKKLKGKKVSITESLTKMRMEVRKDHARSLNLMFATTAEK